MTKTPTRILLFLILGAGCLTSLGSPPLRTIKRERCILRELAPGRGFEVIRQTGETSHVLAHIPKGNLMRAMKNPLFRKILDCYDQAQKRTCNAVTLRDAREPERVDPLLTDLWHQFAPYNMLTPTIDGQHCATGCVAHALAQILRYHRYACGSGSYSYTDSAGCGLRLTATFPQEGYSFENMPDRCDNEMCSPEQLQSVAELLRDCGVWMHMKYGVEASAAATIRQPMALANILGYSRGLQMYFRDFFPYTDWIRMLRHELANGRPVLMLGQSASLSHAFCCDGYDENGLFHLNLGMAGDADGFYYLPYLTPKQPEWYDEDNPEGGMNLIQAITIGICPPSPQEPDNPECHSFGMECIKSLTSKALRGDTLRVVTQRMGNLGWNLHTGRVALMLKQNGTILKPLQDYKHDFKLTELEDTTYTDTLSFVLPQDVKAGFYHLVAAFTQPRNRWEEVRTAVGEPNYLILNIEKDSITLKRDNLETSKIVIEDWQFPDTIIQNSKPHFSLSLRANEANYCGRFYVVLSPENNNNDLRIIQMQGLTLQEGEHTTRSFQRTWVRIPTGTYNLRIAYDHSILSDSITWATDSPLQKVQVVSSDTGVNTAKYNEAQIFVDILGRPEPKQKHGLFIQKEGLLPAKKILK